MESRQTPSLASGPVVATSPRLRRPGGLVGEIVASLNERVQQGLQSHGFANGPLSRYEYCLEDFHRRVQEACPVTRQSEEPAPGFSRTP